jgi:toxin CcdB
MARFDVHRLPNGAAVVDVQADLLFSLATRVVVPLLPQPALPKPVRDLNPILNLGGIPHILLTQAIASVPRAELGPPLATLAPQQDAITRALDTLLTGF